MKAENKYEAEEWRGCSDVEWDGRPISTEAEDER